MLKENLGRLADKNTAHNPSRLSVDLQLHIAPGGCNVVPLKNEHASYGDESKAYTRVLS